MILQDKESVRSKEAPALRACYDAIDWNTVFGESWASATQLRACLCRTTKVKSSSERRLGRAKANLRSHGFEIEVDGLGRARLLNPWPLIQSLERSQSEPEEPWREYRRIKEEARMELQAKKMWEGTYDA